MQHLCASPLPGLATGLFSLDGVAPTVANGCWVAPTAAVIGNVIMHEHSSVWFAAVIRGDGEAPITIGARTNIQDGAVLHSDAGSPLTIESGVTVGHQAMLHGCIIGENTLIGIGATVLNGAVVGKNCVIGARALVKEGMVVPDGSVVMGIPGRVVKQVKSSGFGLSIEGLKRNGDFYVANAKRFMAGLRAK